MAFEVQNFEEDVIAASRQKPVLVDFWAPWCGPCRMLGPVLEKLAGEADDWTLVKINTDAHQDLSQRFGIRGIPAVKLFVDGAVADEFTGALPEHQVRQWLQHALPSAQRERLDAAAAALDHGDVDGARALLREVAEAEPDNAQALAMLAHLHLFDDPDEATALAQRAAQLEVRFLPFAEAVATFTGLLATQKTPDALPEGTGQAAYREALDALATFDFDTALERFIGVIQTDRYYHDDAARKAVLALFTLLDENHPLVKKHRRTFDRALY